MTEKQSLPEPIGKLARRIYEGSAEVFLDRLAALLEQKIPGLPSEHRRSTGYFTEKDVLVITYANSLIDSDSYPLHALREFTHGWLQDTATYLHILPFFPYTSDDGFAISDYCSVNPSLGTWKDINKLAEEVRLAFDLVLNHSSVFHPWFKAFLAQTPPYDEYYLYREKNHDTSKVVRPRTHPLLTTFHRNDESEVHVWTTFSDDQVDLDFSNPLVLLEFIDILLFYIRQGASMVRLDAVSYLWKEDGTSCIHLEKTHLIIQLLRSLIDYYQLDTIILTETNVPHQDNISYFGSGADEAHMVYNFTLPPLVLHSFVFGHAEILKAWASTLPQRQRGHYFLNFLASHDGIGITPGYDWIPREDTAALEQTIKERGGLISYKSTPQGSIAYEYNINYFSGVTDPQEDDQTRIDCFLSSQAVMLELAGVPGIYIHSLLGSVNWREGPDINGYNRAINREKLLLDEINRELADEGSRRSRVYRGFKEMLEARKSSPCFHPEAGQRVAESPPEVFALLRFTDDQQVLCLNNTGAEPAVCPAAGGDSSTLRDLITRRDVPVTDGQVVLQPYETLWLQL